MRQWREKEIPEDSRPGALACIRQNLHVPGDICQCRSRQENYPKVVRIILLMKIKNPVPGRRVSQFQFCANSPTGRECCIRMWQ